MRFLDLQTSLQSNLFTLLDVRKQFHQESAHSIHIQLTRFTQKGLIAQIKRGIYCFQPDRVNEFILANYLYFPSYISLETALNYYGIIPDIPQTVTSIDLTTTRKITNQFGSFSYSKVKSSLFWGYQKVAVPQSQDWFSIAQPEKALLDYFYIRKIKQIRELRLNLDRINYQTYKAYIKHYPEFLLKINLKNLP